MVRPSAMEEDQGRIAMGRPDLRRKPLLIVLALSLLPVGVPELHARAKRSTAMEAAEAAKNDFAARNTPQGTPFRQEAPAVGSSRFEAQVRQVYGDGTALLKSEEGPAGGPWASRLDFKAIPLVAQSRRQFQGRKDLVPEDLDVGQRLRIRYRRDSGRILEVKILRSRATSGS